MHPLERIRQDERTHKSQCVLTPASRVHNTLYDSLSGDIVATCIGETCYIPAIGNLV